MVKIDYPLDKIRHMHAEYTDATNSPKDVAKRYYIAYPTMLRMFRSAGLPVRPARAKDPHCKAKNWDSQKTEQFYNAYLTQPLCEVARQYGMCPSTVYNTLRRCGLRTQKQIERERLDRIAKEI